MTGLISRRGLIATGAATAGALLLPGCDQLSSAPTFKAFLDSAEGATRRAQRLR